MTGTTSSSAFEYTRPVQGGRDASWYGTLGLLAACLVVLADRLLRRLIEPARARHSSHPGRRLRRGPSPSRSGLRSPAAFIFILHTREHKDQGP